MSFSLLQSQARLGQSGQREGGGESEYARWPLSELEDARDFDRRPAGEPDSHTEDQDDDHAKLAELAAAEPCQEREMREVEEAESEANAE